MKRLIACVALLVMLYTAALADTRIVTYGELFSTTNDNGRLAVRYLWLGDDMGYKDKPGDSMIITFPNGQVMLLDTGNYYCVQYVIDALRAMGIEKIDYLLISHPHVDHLGGAATIINTFDVGTVYSNSVAYVESPSYLAFINAVENKNLEHIFLHEGMTLDFGKDVKAYVYNPPAEIEYPNSPLSESTQFMNNQSITLKLEYGQSTYLFAGDLYSIGERAVTDCWGDALDCDVVKANHHGAGTSSSPRWRKTVTPKITVMTHCMLHDLFVAQKYLKVSDVYHTFFEGNICISTAGDGSYDVLIEKEYKPERYTD